MPETTVDENHLPESRKNEVGTSRKVLDVESVTVAEGMRDLADDDFRLGMSLRDSRHHASPFLASHNVHRTYACAT